MANTFDDLQALRGMFAQDFAPINRLGAGQVAIAEQAFKRRQELEDQMRKNIFTQELLERQQRFLTGRDKKEAIDRLGLLREQNKLLGERQQADDERAAKKIFDAEAASAGVETKGKTPEQVRKEIDTKLSGSVQADMQKRTEYAQRVVEIMRRSSAASKARVTQKALMMPDVVKAFEEYPDQLAALRSGSITIDRVIENLASDYVKWYNPFGHGQDKAGKIANTAFESWVKAFKQVTELDKETNPDFQLAADMSNLQGRIQNLDLGIAEKFHKIANPDVRSRVFPELSPLPPWVDPNRTGAATTPAPPSDPLLGLAMPPAKLRAVTVSPAGAVVPAPAGLPRNDGAYPFYAP